MKDFRCKCLPSQSIPSVYVLKFVAGCPDLLARTSAVLSSTVIADLNVVKDTLRNSVPGKLFKLFEVDNASGEEGFEAFTTLFGAVVFQVFIGQRLLDLFLSVEDIADVQLFLNFASVLLPISPILYFLKSLKMDIK